MILGQEYIRTYPIAPSKLSLDTFVLISVWQLVYITLPNMAAQLIQLAMDLPSPA